MPNQLEYLGDYVFDFCESLKEVELPATLTRIGFGAFKYTALESVEWPAGVHELEDHVFLGCTNLKFSIPDHITRIGRSAFQGCSSITEVVIPASVETIEGFAFAETGISSFQAPASTTINWEGFFMGCKNITSVKLPDNMEVIPNSMFNGCENLTDVTIPATVHKIDNWAFSYCTSLQDFPWPAALDTIGNYAFDGCLTLEQDIVLPEGLETLGDHVFNSSGITSLTIPSTLTKTGSFIVNGCSNLQVVYWNSASGEAKPFWLRELTAEGFKDATTIEANKPYIIAFPNNDIYLSEYRINGNIEFSATNAEVLASKDLTSVVGPEFTFSPTFTTIPKSNDIWVLNENQYTSPIDGNTYYDGGIFIKSTDDKRDVRPFECYVTNTASRSYIPVGGKAASTRAARKVGPIPAITDM